MDEIDEHFAYLTGPDGRRFQVLVRDAQGEAVDWDEAATHAMYDREITP